MVIAEEGMPSGRVPCRPKYVSEMTAHVLVGFHRENWTAGDDEPSRYGPKIVPKMINR